MMHSQTGIRFDPAHHFTDPRSFAPIFFDFLEVYFQEKQPVRVTRPRNVSCTTKTPVFTADEFKRWLRGMRIRPRYGAVGQHVSIALIEWFILIDSQAFVHTCDCIHAREDRPAGFTHDETERIGIFEFERDLEPHP